jgi:hypothetical protein
LEIRIFYHEKLEKHEKRLGIADVLAALKDLPLAQRFE